MFEGNLGISDSGDNSDITVFEGDLEISEFRDHSEFSNLRGSQKFLSSKATQQSGNHLRLTKDLR